MYHRPVLRYHDAALLRCRYALLIEKVVSAHHHVWGKDIPGDDHFAEIWRAGPPPLERTTPTHESRGDLGLLLDSLTPEALIDRNPPTREFTVPYREAALSILAYTGGSDGLTITEVALRYFTIVKHLGGNCSALVDLRSHLTKIFKTVLSSNRALRVVSTTDSGERRYAFDMDLPRSDMPSMSSLPWFGQTAVQHYEKLAYLEDDIAARPTLLVQVGRKSALKQGTQRKEKVEEIRQFEESLDKQFRYYLATFNGRGKAPVDINTKEDMATLAEESDPFYAYQYLISPRNSRCPIFENNFTSIGASDKVLMDILQRLDDDAKHRGLTGDDRPLVIYTLFGVDCWSTSSKS